MRQSISKSLPKLPTDIQDQIAKELDTMSMTAPPVTAVDPTMKASGRAMQAC